MPLNIWTLCFTHKLKYSTRMTSQTSCLSFSERCSTKHDHAQDKYYMPVSTATSSCITALLLELSTHSEWHCCGTGDWYLNHYYRGIGCIASISGQEYVKELFSCQCFQMETNGCLNPALLNSRYFPTAPSLNFLANRIQVETPTRRSHSVRPRCP